MAIPTLSTGLSRRAMLAGGVAAPAFPVLQALAALPETAVPDLGADPDAALFRRIAEAEELRKQYAQARRLRDRIRAARWAREKTPPLPWRGPFPSCDIETYLHYPQLFHSYADAVRAAVAIPARTLAGLHAKLALAVIAARRGNARIYMYEDREWLEAALADLERLADQGPRWAPSHPTQAPRHASL